jgi:hypothetical protein
MIKDREPIPEHLICDAIYFDMVDLRSIWDMPHTTCEGIIRRMDAVCIHPAFPAVHQSFDAIVDSVEKALSVERAALEYDSNATHMGLIVFSEK